MDSMHENAAMGSVETLSPRDSIFTVLVSVFSLHGHCLGLGVSLSRYQDSSRHLTIEETHHLIDTWAYGSFVITCLPYFILVMYYFAVKSLPQFHGLDALFFAGNGYGVYPRSLHQ